MADSKITKKLHPSGSLGRRIVIASILLLAIPLFLQNLFLYREEYKEKLADVENDLKMLSEERAYLIQEIIEMNWAFLQREKMQPNQGGNVKPLYIQKIATPPHVNGPFVLPSKDKKALLIGVLKSRNEAVAIEIPFFELVRHLPREYPIGARLLDQNRESLWGEALSSKEGDFLTAQSSIGKTGLFIELSVEKTKIHGLHLESYSFRIVTLIFFVGVVGGSALYWFIRRVSRPLKELCKAMQRVQEGAAHVRYKPDWMGFEINQLGMQFNETLEGLLKHEKEAEKQRSFREKLALELQIGHEIQSSLVPSHLSQIATLDVAALYLSAKEVNGDFYDLFQLENGKWLIAICDTAGKGIAACLFSLSLRSFLRSFAGTSEDLSELVIRTNDLYLIDAHPSSMFATAWIALFDPIELKLTFCSQGHPAALLVRENQVEELWTEGIAFGAQKIDAVHTKEVTLKEEDLLVLYTDGVVEAHDVDGNLFGKKRLIEVLLRKKRGTSQQIADAVIENVHLFSQAAIQHDDLTLVVLQMRKADKK